LRPLGSTQLDHLIGSNDIRTEEGLDNLSLHSLQAALERQRINVSRNGKKNRATTIHVPTLSAGTGAKRSNSISLTEVTTTEPLDIKYDTAAM
jgi:hypothetical protein